VGIYIDILSLINHQSLYRSRWLILDDHYREHKLLLACKSFIIGYILIYLAFLTMLNICQEPILYKYYCHYIKPMGYVVVRNWIVFTSKLLEKLIDLVFSGVYPKFVLFHDVRHICVGLLLIDMKLLRYQLSF
jgi:hypothetical protein